MSNGDNNLNTDDSLLINLFISDIVLFLSQAFLSNYANENHFYSIEKNWI